MPKMIIKGYDAVINCDWLGDGASILIGVIEEGHPDDIYFDSWADQKIYYYLTCDEFANLKVGDVLNDGEDFTIIEIDKDEPHIFEIEYEEYIHA
jgi:hypothetical protein